MMTILQYLRVDPVRFLRQALHGGNLELGFERPKAEPPEIVRRAVKRLTKGDERGSLDDSFIQTLDEIRYEQPHEALRQARWAVNHLKVDLLPSFLGVLASILRHLSRLDDAEHALFAGLEIAEGQNAHKTVAALLKRLAFVVADSGELEQALLISERAMVTYLRLGDSFGVARCIYDQAVWLNYLGRYKESVAVTRATLELLPTEARQNRLAALHLLAQNHYELGAHELALDNLMGANRLLKGNAHLAEDKVQWLLANIRADLGELKEAEGLLKQVLDRFCTYQNGEEALLICDLVSVQLRQGKAAKAYETAQKMLKLLEPLRHDRIISAAIAELLRLGQEGLTLALVERVQNRIKGELRPVKNIQRR